MTAHGDQLLAPYHPVRRIVAGTEAPWPGLIVRTDSGDTTVMIDAADLPSGWAGWSADPEGHLLATLDVVRTADGHAVLTPLCTTRLDSFLGRRAARRALLTDGEMVTLVVSIARGLRQAEATNTEHGQWWLTDAGRPVLATEEAQVHITVSSGEVLSGLRAAAESPLSWSWLDAWPTSSRELLALEARAFDIAPPQSLADAPSSTVTPWPLDDRASPRSATGPTPADGTRQTLLERMGRHLDSDVADLVSRSLTGVRRRLQRPGRVSHKRLAIVSVSVWLAILAVGLLWPMEEDSSPAQARHPTADSTPRASPHPEVSGGEVSVSTELTNASGPDTSTEPVDITGAVSDLLSRRTACEGDTGCLGEVMVRPAADFPPGVIDAAEADRRVTLVDDYGGVAVARVDPVADASQPPLLVVVQRTEEKWLLRDVYVTQQP
ncbi:hypothetical protein [Microbacterium sp. SLBN-146]|uniref:hypothetical protein n=1 Tax=Microbacterium sp. SLBN-146 TaxID=2768457 RepID=UPI0011520262|nr:hypothetical protein [Microbacterium sp. SLBN-146]TQJ32118.1 hypothetical protein FBY39_2618 [Microbacterium sp. SLBN-146]